MVVVFVVEPTTDHIHFALRRHKPGVGPCCIESNIVCLSRTTDDHLSVEFRLEIISERSILCLDVQYLSRNKCFEIGHPVHH